MLDKLNKLALELYSELGFTTCTQEQQELILRVCRTRLLPCKYVRVVSS